VPSRILLRLFCVGYFAIKFSLCFNWAPRHEGVLREWSYSSTHSLTSALDGGEKNVNYKWMETKYPRKF
jgi:hypothetical protein